MRALLVGAGGMGRAWAKNIDQSKDVTLAGWSDVRPGVAAEAASTLKIEGVACGHDLLADLERVKPDFVIDVTPPEIHEKITTLALGLGLPVLGEKPMAHSIDAARNMIAASEKSGKLYMVSQSRRYDGGLTAFLDLASTVGELGILNSDFYIGAHFGGFRDEMASPLVLDMAIHTFDTARLISGRNAIKVYCDDFNPKWSWYKGNASSTAIFTLENDARYTYRGSWCSNGLNTSWECDWRAVGSEGTATWDGRKEILAETAVQTGEFTLPVSRSTREPTKVQGGIEGSLAEFVDALKTGKTPQGECHDNFYSLAMVFGALESAAKGIPVSVPTL